MKTTYRPKNIFSSFLATISCLFLLLSISSCELFTFSKLEENENAANASEQLSSSNTCNLHITPRFGNETLHTQGSSRSAFPDFSSIPFSDYTFKATSTVLAGEVTGAYNLGTGNISFSFSAATFSEPTEFTFYICDSSGKELFYGTQQITYTTLGSEISKTVYFKSYDSSEVNGRINLNVAVTGDYTLSCEIKNSSDESVCGNTGDPISVDSSGNITTGTDGIAPGTYKAYISVKKGSQLYDYIIQEINVWPDLTTNRWYLPDGSTSDTYTINISEDKVKFWVKGTSPGGPYASDVIVPVSYTADGSITKPFTSLNAAIAACTSNTTNYRIVVSGTINENATIGSSVSAHSITIEGCEGSTNDILKQSSSGAVLTIDNTFPVTLRKIRVMDGQQSGIKVTNSSCAGLYLLDDAFIYMNASGDMGGGIYSMAPVIVDGATIKRNNAERGGGIAIDSVRPSESYGLIIKSGTICENLTINADDLFGGGGVYASDSTVSMTSGTISSNETESFGGALYLYESEFYISDSAYIPAGNEKQNYIYLNNSAITITGKLTPPVECTDGLIAALKLAEYTEARRILDISPTTIPATTLSEETGKFYLIQPEGSSEKWLLLNAGKIYKEVPESYVTANAISTTTLTSTLTSSRVFVANRTVSIPKMIVSDHELTQKEYLEYCFYDTKIPGTTTFNGNGTTQMSPQGDNYPAIFISWYDVIVYCNLRSIDEGLTPAYSLGGKTNPVEWDDTTIGTGTNSGKYCGPSSDTPEWNAIDFDTSANGWRMPTELEWEYLARGGTLNDTGLLVIDSTNYNIYAWTSENTPTKVCHEVKQLEKNTLNLYDVYGNVYELVWDWSGSIDTSTPLIGNSTGERRIVRGGGMGYGWEYCNSYDRRTDNLPYSRWENSGVRIVRNAD